MALLEQVHAELSAQAPGPSHPYTGDRTVRNIEVGGLEEPVKSVLRKYMTTEEADAIAMVVPADTVAYMKGGSIDWNGFHCLAVAGQMIVRVARKVGPPGEVVADGRAVRRPECDRHRLHQDRQRHSAAGLRSPLRSWGA